MIFTPVTILWPNINLEKIYNFHAVMGDSLEWNITVVGLDLTGYAIRGEVYDLNTSIRMANTEGGAQSAPEIVLTYASAEYSCFTATVQSNVTNGMQKYAQVEFEITDSTGKVKTTILQQAISYTFPRIIWAEETQNLNDNGDGENPLF